MEKFNSDLAIQSEYPLCENFSSVYGKCLACLFVENLCKPDYFSNVKYQDLCATINMSKTITLMNKQRICIVEEIPGYTLSIFYQLRHNITVQ